MSSDQATGERGFVLRLTRVVAIAGAFVLVAIVAVTVVSVLSRRLMGSALLGDYELIEFGVSIAVFAFLPYTHATDNHVVATFFTDRLSARWKNRLDAIQNVIFAVVIGLLGWRTLVGGIDRFETGGQTMFLGMPFWWLHVAGAAGLALLGWVALWKVMRIGAR